MKPVIRFAAILPLFAAHCFQTATQAAHADSGRQVFRIVVPQQVQTRIVHDQFQLHSSVPVGVQTTKTLKTGATKIQTQVYVPGNGAFRWHLHNRESATTTVLTICPL